MIAHARVFVEFCVEDAPRYQLLFQRPIPGFEPSPESYTAAVEGLELTRAAVAACGVRGPRAFDAFTALITGITAQQTANEPGGRRWTRLVEEMVDMYLAHYRTNIDKEPAMTTTSTTTAVAKIPPILHDGAMDLADAEYALLLADVDALTDTEWALPTDCTGWTVKDLLGHILGMLELQADPAEMRRQVTAAAAEVADPVAGGWTP